MKRIPDSLTSKFSEQSVRKEIIEKFGHDDEIYVGTNAFGDTVNVVIDAELGMKLTTYQANGWIRVNYYDREGIPSGETFDGRWKS